MAKIIMANDKGIAEAVDALQSGKIVAMPTETVYGLAADARNAKAVGDVFAAKGRPNFNPLISHMASFEMAMTYAEYDERAALLAQNFWPGPLTLVLKRKTNAAIADNVTAGLETIAMRVPAHPVARQLIKACGFPLAAPSANKSGTLSPTTPQHVQNNMGDHIPFILASGKCKCGVESTIIDLTHDVPVMLRPGTITQDEIESLIGVIDTEFKVKKGQAPKAPGQLLRHYAPNAKIRLQAVDVKKGEALLGFGSVKFMGVDEAGAASDLYETRYQNLSETGDLEEAAANLFDMLQKLDHGAYDTIAVMDVPHVGIGVAINDRLSRAAKLSEI